MRPCFFDSSALAKLFIDEIGSERVQQLAGGLAREERIISRLALIEIRSALRRREAAREVSAEDVQIALEQLELASLNLQILSVSEAVMSRSRQVVDVHRLRALDALQLATALTYTHAKRLPDLTFVASDNALLREARTAGLRTFNPEVGF